MPDTTELTLADQLTALGDTQRAVRGLPPRSAEGDRVVALTDAGDIDGLARLEAEYVAAHPIPDDPEPDANIQNCNPLQMRNVCERADCNARSYGKRDGVRLCRNHYRQSLQAMGDPVRLRPDNAFAVTHPRAFVEVDTVPAVRAFNLAFIGPLNKSGAAKRAVATALLAGRTDFVQAASATLYFRVAYAVRRLAKYASLHHRTVARTLDELESEHRIYRMPSASKSSPSRRLLIGARRGTLFVPYLTAGRLWNATVGPFLRAFESGDNTAAERYSDMLAIHLVRLTDDEIAQLDPMLVAHVRGIKLVGVA